MGLGDVALINIYTENVSRLTRGFYGRAKLSVLSSVAGFPFKSDVKNLVFLPGWYAATTLWVQSGKR